MPIRPRRIWLFLPVVGAVCSLALVMVPVRAGPPPTPSDNAFADKANPFLNQFCNKCHNSEKSAGGVPLDIYKTTADARKDAKMWETISRVVANGEMPPKSKPQPPAAVKAAFLTLVDDTLVKVNCVTGPKDPGRVTLRRLNRAEYNNTIRDLCGVDFKPADDFPSDDVGYGFDNIGDVLSLPPILLEKYLTAADRVLTAAITPPGSVPSTKQKFGPQNLQVRPRNSRLKDDRIITFTTDGSASLDKFNFPAAGEYVVRARTFGVAADGVAAKVAVRVDGKDVTTTEVAGTREKPIVVEARVRVEPGEKRVAVAFANPSDPDKLTKDVTPRKLSLLGIEVEGPTGGGSKPLPASTKLVLTTIPAVPADAKAVDSRAAAEEVLHTFARRAFRRPATPNEITRLMRLYDQAAANGDSFDQAVRLPLKAILVSPHFLFRVETDSPAGQAAKLLTEYELASRLSYFLWASMPDEQLLSVAARGELRKPGVLRGQVARMLADKKSAALVENFAGQWLNLRSLKTVTPDAETFKTFDEPLRLAMIRESEMFFEHIVRNDRSVLEFLDADYTFVNDRLSWHYGIPNVEGPDFRYVKLTDKRRGGLVTQASVLTVTSNPTRTSPVKRGKWIYENIFGLQPPPAAPDVPELPPTNKIKGSLRQQMEQHRANPACASCHAKLDPLGFGLENFNAIGQWRDKDNQVKIDASGVLPDGAKFDGPTELRKTLLAKADLFRHCLAEKLLTYALGRGLEHADKCVLDEIGAKVQSGNDKFSALVLAIVESDAFQKRKGKRSE